MPLPRAHFKRVLKRFAVDDSGATAVFYGIMFTVILLSSAIAIDYSRMASQKTRDQRATDAAVLAAGRLLGVEDNVVIRERADAIYNANIDTDMHSELEPVQLDTDTGTVTGKSIVDWKATFMKAFGYDNELLSSDAQATKPEGTVEIALVLDNSGSMSSDLGTLKAAAVDLTSVIFAGRADDDKVKIGVVPFAASVNVGSANASAGWMDATGANPIHRENFEVGATKTRFQLFSDLGVTWGGCVEARDAGLDVTDAVPSAGAPNTLFVPMFAPDEPGNAGSTSRGFYNSYLDDDGGQCTPYPVICTNYSRRGNCTRSYTERPSDLVAQESMCKYPSGQVDFGSGRGPNYGCTTRAILPLTDTKSTIESAINAMQASGYTNIKEGVAWGWRVLSKDPPFIEGRDQDEAENRKMLILMTDGRNELAYTGNMNGSLYLAQGFGKDGRLGNSHSSGAYRSNINARTSNVCANAKVEGITIYTVAFRLENDPVTTQLLGACASSPDHVFRASDGETLQQSFRDIARRITELHISG